MACEEVFLRELRERGFRLTPQREMVLSVMHQADGLVTADDIYGRVREISTAVDVSTVYRTLDLLQELKLVACIDPGDGQNRYELLGVHGPHIHLVCQSCNKVIGIEQGAAQTLADQLLAERGFALNLDCMTLLGLCRECSSQLKPSSPFGS